MSSFIREPWIHSLLCDQLYRNVIPSTSQRCQLIDIVGKADALEVIVSDCIHSITAVLSRESTTNFKKTYALDWVDVKGCLMTLDRFCFDYSFEKNAFFICTEDFSYFGSESEIIGDPISVNHAKDIREVLGHGVCGKLHISELDPLYCVVERETSDRRRVLDLVLENTTGKHIETFNKCPNGDENMAHFLKQDDFVGIDADKTEKSQNHSVEILATHSMDYTASPVQNSDSGCSRAFSSSDSSVTMCVSSQEECVVSGGNRQHTLHEECAAKNDTSKENVIHTPERPDCSKIQESALFECTTTTCSVLPPSICYKKERGVIDFHDIGPTTSFDLSIFTKIKKNRTADNRYA